MKRENVISGSVFIGDEEYVLVSKKYKDTVCLGPETIMRKYNECPEFYQRLLKHGFDSCNVPSGADLDNFIFASNDGTLFYAAEPNIDEFEKCAIIKYPDISKLTLEDIQKIYDKSTYKKAFGFSAEEVYEDLKNHGVAEAVIDLYESVSYDFCEVEEFEFPQK